MSRPAPRIAYRVDDLVWPAHRHGGLAITFPVGDALEVGQRVAIFDVDYVLTQHEVITVQFPNRAILGPAIRWPDKSETQRHRAPRQ